MESKASVGGLLKEFRAELHRPGEFLVTLKIQTVPMSCDESVQTACWMFMVDHEVLVELTTNLSMTEFIAHPWDLATIHVPPRVVGGSVVVNLHGTLNRLGDGSLVRFWWE